MKKVRKLGLVISCFAICFTTLIGAPISGLPYQNPLCGTVTAYTPATEMMDGSITINGTPYKIKKGTNIPGDIFIGDEVCFSGVMNGMIGEGGAVITDCCNKICFSTPQFFLGNLSHLPVGTILIGGGQLDFQIVDIQTNLSTIMHVLQGGASPLQRLNRDYVAAQLSLVSLGGINSPIVDLALNSKLRLYGGALASFPPVMLSNGFIGRYSTVKELIRQAELAIRQNQLSDIASLAPLFEQLATCPGAPGIMPTPFHCDTICFRSPQFFLRIVDRLPTGTVLVGGVNFNNPISTSNSTMIKFALQGGFSPLQQLNRQYVAAQLNLISAGGNSSPPVFNALWGRLICSGGALADFDPVILSTGFIFTPSAKLMDVFQQAELAIRGNRTIDMPKLAALFELLNGNDPNGRCR